MPDNGDDGLSSDDLIRKAKEELGHAEEDAPVSDGPTEDQVEDEESLSAPVADQPIEEPAEAFIRDEDAASGSRDSGTPTPPILPSTPPTPPSGPQEVAWYRRGWVRGLGAGVVALGVFLFNSGVFDPSPEEQAEAAIVESLQENGVSESSAECVAEGMRDGGYLDSMADLDESEVEEIGDFSLSSGLSDAPPEFQHFMEGMFLYIYDPTVGCLSPSELTAFVEAPDESGFGSDPQAIALVGSLTAGCREGSLADCDMLWHITDPGSPGEAVAESCGDRNGPLDFNVTTCVLEHQSDADYQILVDECDSGFYVACDVLYGVSIVGSENETFAESCGERREPNPNLPCVAQFGLGTRG